MTRNNSQNHPDLDALLAFSEERLVGAEKVEVEQHLESCAQCRLEIKSFQRFNELGQYSSKDQESEDQAVQWDRAELELERAWHENIQPAIKIAPSLGRPTRRRSLVWLVPAAVAAVAALIFLGPTLSPESFSPPTVSSVIRGAEEDSTSQISLGVPFGQLESQPEKFLWQTEVECEHFTLEIFTSDLKSIYVKSELEIPSWTMTKEVAHLLEPEKIYLWNVRGLVQLKPVAESGNNWFRFPKVD